MCKTVEILKLGPIIDPEAFRAENLNLDWSLPKNVYWENRRLKAYKIATRIIEAGYNRA